MPTVLPWSKLNTQDLLLPLLTIIVGVLPLGDTTELGERSSGRITPTQDTPSALKVTHRLSGVEVEEEGEDVSLHRPLKSRTGVGVGVGVAVP